MGEMLRNSPMLIVSLKSSETHVWQSKQLFNFHLRFWLCPAVPLCLALFTHPSQILWTESSSFTQVEVPPARNVKISCDFKAKLMCLHTIVLHHPYTLIKAGLRNAEITAPECEQVGGGGGEGQEGTCNVTVRELCLGLKTISIR